MKKIVAVLFLALFVFASGCSNVPKYLTQEGYDTGTKALDSINQYLKGETSKDETAEKLDMFSDLLETYYDKEEDISKRMRLMSLSLDCMMAASDIRLDDIEGLLDYRDSISETLNGK